MARVGLETRVTRGAWARNGRLPGPSHSAHILAHHAFEPIALTLRRNCHRWRRWCETRQCRENLVCFWHIMTHPRRAWAAGAAPLFVTRHGAKVSSRNQAVKWESGKLQDRDWPQNQDQDLRSPGAVARDSPPSCPVGLGSTRPELFGGACSVEDREADDALTAAVRGSCARVLVANRDRALGILAAFHRSSPLAVPPRRCGSLISTTAHRHQQDWRIVASDHGP